MGEIKSNTEVLRGVLNLQGLRVLDIGSGAGNLVRYMTKHGAIATGLECGAAQLEKVRNTPVQGDEVYVEGFGQDMPLDGESFDAAIFFNSLHHVPVEHMGAALKEGIRVLKAGCVLYIAEPVAKGPSFEVHLAIDDETVVRQHAIDAMAAACAAGLMVQEQEISYDTDYHYQDFEDLKEESIRIDPVRKAVFDEKEAEMRESFLQLGVPSKKGYRFDQPMRVNVFRKP